MNAPRFIPGVPRSPAEPEYAQALVVTRIVLATTCDRLANCSSSRLPGRAVGSLCDLQRATDHLRHAQGPSTRRAHARLIEALDELQEDIAELARRGGPSDAILRSRGLARAERALSRLAA